MNIFQRLIFAENFEIICNMPPREKSYQAVALPETSCSRRTPADRNDPPAEGSSGAKQATKGLGQRMIAPLGECWAHLPFFIGARAHAFVDGILDGILRYGTQNG
jgi:hypothetical protein